MHGPMVSVAWTGIVATLLLADAGSSLRLLVVLPFVLLVPGLAVVQLLGLTNDAAAQITLALATSIALAVLIPLGMLHLGIWSPSHGLLVLMAITAGAAGLKITRTMPTTELRDGAAAGTEARRPQDEAAKWAGTVGGAFARPGSSY